MRLAIGAAIRGDCIPGVLRFSGILLDLFVFVRLFPYYLYLLRLIFPLQIQL